MKTGKGRAMSALLLLALVAILALIPLTLIARAYFIVRGARLVTCPETKQPAAVEVDATRAAVTALLGGPALRLRDCSRWPGREGCGQECLREIEAAPADCLVRTILTRWYEGKFCVSCGRDLGRVDWREHKPALLSPEGKTVDWHEVVPENLREMLSTHMPICWDCHVARTFRRLYPELVVDRPWHATGARLKH